MLIQHLLTHIKFSLTTTNNRIVQLLQLLCISGWLSVRNRQCLYKQDATSHTKSCTSIYSVVIPIHLNREMASVYTH